MSEEEKGREALATFCTIMDMLPPSSDNNWMMHKDVICNRSVELINNEFIEAGKWLRQQILKEDDLVTESSTWDVIVSFDGT